MDCSNITYTSEVSPVIAAAAEQLEQERTPQRGWTTEDDKKQKILNLTSVKKAIESFGDDYVSILYDIYHSSGSSGDFSYLFCLLLEIDVKGCKVLVLNHQTSPQQL